MPKPVPIGARHELERTVALENTLTAAHHELPPVLSTPWMIAWMEAACYLALQPYAEGDEITVGTHIDVGHRAPTGVGVKVKGSAELERIEGRFHVMRVRAWTEHGEIGSGTVHRAFVSVGRFMQKQGVK